MYVPLHCQMGSKKRQINAQRGLMIVEKSKNAQFSDAKVQSFLQICKQERENERFFLRKIVFPLIFRSVTCFIEKKVLSLHRIL